MRKLKLKELLLLSTACFGLQISTCDALLAGVKTLGMSSTSTARPIDAFAPAYNPAGLTVLCDRYDVGLSWVHNTQSLTITNNTAHIFTGGLIPNQNGTYNGAVKDADVYVPEFAIKKDLPCCWCPNGWKISTGVAVYNRAYNRTRYGNALELIGTSTGSPASGVATIKGLEYIQETAAASIAVKFHRMHTLGLAVNLNFQRIELEGLQNFANAIRSTDPTHSTNQGNNWSTGVGVVFGYLFQPVESLKIGLAYQPSTHMSKFNKYKGFIVDHGKFPIPERFNAGIAYTICCKATFAFDYEFINWRKIPQLRNSFFVPGPVPPLPSNPLLGAKDGPGFNWNNQHFFRFGFEWMFNDYLTVRCGYRHANTPVKKESAAINLITLDTAENFLTFGFTILLKSCTEFSFFTAHSWENSVKGPIPPGSPLSVPAFAPLFGGDARVKQRIDVVGVSVGRYF